MLDGRRRAVLSAASVVLVRFGQRQLHSSAIASTSWRESFSHTARIEPELGDKRPTHIIVGAGSAGCVLAARLTEDPNNRVLLVEAGPRDHWWDWRLHMPSALMFNLRHDEYNWFYHTVAQPYLDDRAIYWPRGRVWGGSSTINAMCYVRGHALDYDRWANEEGATGWDYASCLPYFKRSESYTRTQGASDTYRGHDGPLRVQRASASHPLHQAFLQVGKLHSIGSTDDMNGFKQDGIGYIDQTISEGVRCSAARAYLHPILGRPNLHVSSGLTATRVLFDGNCANGIEVINAQRFSATDNIDSFSREKIYCTGEVVLAAGAVNTPCLLLYSGVGPHEHLRAFHVPTVVHLPGVGQNLQDHVEVYVQQRSRKRNTLYNKSSWKFPHNMLRIGAQWLLRRDGLGASSHLETGGFARSSPSVPHPDIQFHFLPGTVHEDGRVTGSCHAYQVHVGPMRPASRGFVRLQNRDPRRPPLIQPYYLKEQRDVEEMRACVRLARELFASAPFDEFRGAELAPGANVQTDAEIDAWVRKFAASAYHPCGTAKMGPSTDRMAVVDPVTLRVHGTERLRVCDASIMPSVVSGNLNAPVIMMAEKAADIVCGRQPLPPEPAPVWNSKQDGAHT